MYWLRTSPGLDVLFWILLSALWWLGGWLISTHIFHLRSRDRLISGLGIGLLLFIAFSNLMAHLFPLVVAYWAGAGLLLAIGLFAAWRASDRALLDIADLRAWPQLLVLAGLVLFFTLINRGLAIWDDYHNLPLVSMMATGDVPPHFYLNTEVRLAFHYGLHLFAASMVRIGTFTPWSAFDISKAFSLSLSAMLAWLWFRRVTGNTQGGFWGSLLAILGGGSRWLLILLPVGALAVIGEDLQFIGGAAQTGPDLATNMFRFSSYDGGGPIPFPFALANGAFPAQVMALGSAGAIASLTLFLILTLNRRTWSWWSAPVFGLLLASLTLIAEHLFVLIWGGLFLAAFIGTLINRDVSRTAHWALILGLSAVLAVTWGGVLTEIPRRFLMELFGGTAVSGSGFSGFGLRWPPAIMTAHLGSLSITRPGHLLVALAELGLALFLAPPVTWWAWKRFQRNDWFTGGLALAAITGAIIPIFVVYLIHDRDISRLTGSALYIWMVLGFPLAWFTARKGSRWLRTGLWAAYALLIAGGIALLIIQSVGILKPQFSNFIDSPDVLLSRKYWNELDPDASVFDKVQHRAITLFGIGGGRAFEDLYLPYPEWLDLSSNPTPRSIAQAGYQYFYYDNRLWRSLDAQERQLFKGDCVTTIAEETGPAGQFRRLLDVSKCQ